MASLGQVLPDQGGKDLPPLEKYLCILKVQVVESIFQLHQVSRQPTLALYAN